MSDSGNCQITLLRDQESAGARKSGWGAASQKLPQIAAASVALCTSELFCSMTTSIRALPSEVRA